MQKPLLLLNLWSMSRSKKPVVLVAIFFALLIVLPGIIWVLAKAGAARDVGTAFTPAAHPVAPATAAVDYELDQLVEKVDSLMAGDIATAVRKGDLALDFVAGLNQEIEKARNDLRTGKHERARERYLTVLNAAGRQLAAVGAAEKAQALKAATYAELQRLEPLRSTFGNTYREAVASYDAALRSLQTAAFPQAVDEFELAGAIMGDLEARSLQQLGTLLEAGQAALENHQLAAASEAFQAALEIDADNRTAKDGLQMLAALEGIGAAIQQIRQLEAAGQLDQALAGLDQLAAAHPENPVLEKQRSSLQARVLERDVQALLARSLEAEQAGDLPAAIAGIEAALKLKPDPQLQARLAQLQQRDQKARLETLLEDGFQALKAGRYEAAREHYKAAAALDANSKEARTGLEKASSLYLAEVRYAQNIASAERYIKEGRFPLAARLFNQAMTSRPEKLPPERLKKESTIREVLEAQSREVPVQIKSDGRTFISIIGVLPPDRFSSKDLKLFPDVYQVRGSRKNYKDVELEIKVDATTGSQTITVQCIEKL